MIGHGLRSRQVRGPAEPGAESVVRVLRLRRYRCRTCSRTVTVVPGGIVARRHYGAWAIALACWLWSFGGAALGEVRRRVAPGRTQEEGWPAMRRWLRAVGAGRLLRGVRPWPEGFGPRQQAERVAATVMSLAPGTYGSAEEQLHAGAAHAA